MLNLTLLRTFLEIVENSSFAVAAEVLSLTPSAVSGHVRRLEELVGKPLLARTTRTVRPTPEGEMLYSYTRELLRLEQEARAKITGKYKDARLRIGASEDFASTWLPQVLRAFRSSNPGLTLELKVGMTVKLLNDYSQRRLDIVIGKQSRPIEGAELLWQENVVWAGCDDFAIAETDHVPLVAFPKPCVLRESATEALADVGRAARLVFESPSFAGCLSAALAGFGLTPIARSQLKPGLRVFGEADGLPSIPNMQYLCLYDTQNSLARDLIGAVRETGVRTRFAYDPLFA